MKPQVFRPLIPILTNNKLCRLGKLKLVKSDKHNVKKSKHLFDIKKIIQQSNLLK